MHETHFIRFWRGLNAALRDAGQPEALYGDAHHYWLLAQQK